MNSSRNSKEKGGASDGSWGAHGHVNRTKSFFFFFFAYKEARLRNPVVCRALATVCVSGSGGWGSIWRVVLEGSIPTEEKKEAKTTSDSSKQKHSVCYFHN